MDFRACYLPDKFWHRRSVLVPKNKIVLDERFKTINDIFLNQAEREAFEVFWLEYMVFGNVRLAGELNYCYIDGKFFHLEKVRSQGFIQNGERDEDQEQVWDYYLEYDDWMNDWQNDRVDIWGTISKTGDINLVKENIVQVAPLIQGQNRYYLYNTISSNKVTNRNIITREGVLLNEKTWLHPKLYNEFNLALQTFNYNEEPNPERLVIPLVATRGRYVGWKYNLYCKLLEFLKDDNLTVYDVKKTGTNIQFGGFKTKYGIKEVYSISVPDYSDYVISQTVNQHIQVKKNINLAGIQDIHILTPELLPSISEGEEINFKDIILPYIDKYSVSESERWDFYVVGLSIFFGYFGKICFNDEVLKNEEVNFLEGQKIGKIYRGVEIKPHKPDNMYWEHPRFGTLENKIWWKDYLNNFVFTQRIITRNFIFEPNTPKLYIAFLRKIGEIELDPNTKYSINKDSLYPAKTPAQWFNTQRVDELMEWLNWLNNNPNYLDPTFNAYSDNPIQYKNTTLHGNLLLLDNSAFKFTDNREEDFTMHEGAVLLLPDYRDKRYTLAEAVYFDGVTNLNVVEFENPKKYIDQNHTYTIIKEIGTRTAEETNDWKKPRTDDVLGNSAKYYEKYCTILPLLIKWSIQNYKYSFDSYGYRFKYEFQTLREKFTSNNTFQSSVVFQFPLIGCGFDVYALLKEYKDKISDRYLIWGFLADEETMKRNGWENRGVSNNEYTFFFYSHYNGTGLADKNSESHLRNFNELIEIRINSLFDLTEDISELLTKLWVYYFGFRWDGSYNGATLNIIENYSFVNYNSLYYIKPFNYRYYAFKLIIKNYIGNDLTTGKSKPVRGQNLLYGYDSFQWNPSEVFATIGYEYIYSSANGLKKRGDEHNGYLLSCMAQNIQIAQNSNNWQTYGLHQTGHMKPDNFAYLLRVSKPWEYIKFELPNPPPENPFRNLQKSNNSFEKLIHDKVHKTNRYPNPTKYDFYKNQYPVDISNSEWNLTAKNLDEWDKLKIPYFIGKRLNPNQPSSTFHNFRYSGDSSLAAKIRDFKSRFEHEIHSANTLISSVPFMFDMVGTEFIVLGKLNVIGDYEFELVSKSNQSLEKSEVTKYEFVVTERDEDNFRSVVKRVNSNFEISIYGQRIPIKTRPDMTLDRIDVGLSIVPINDPKQSEASLWYMVLLEAQQDTQRIRIEVPKEFNALHNQSAYEREEIIRKIAYHASERMVEADQFEMDRNKHRVDMDIKFQRMGIQRNQEITNQSIEIARTVMDTARSYKLAGGWHSPGAWGAVAAGAVALSGQIANKVFAKQLYDLNVQEHHHLASYGAESLENRGNLTRAKHEDAQAGDRYALWNMQNNISYPSNTDALMYKEENKQFELTDIHLIRYCPEGDQLDFLVKYYEEYGFNLVATDVRCFGAGTIKGHIQFTKITSNTHENETIKRMIEERALTGITIVDNDDWHADRVKVGRTEE